ncbi:hypothetical protein L332_03445 [Agrococcus pavilionensis RW1]|uniref:Uncharacterized protein n=1 Tax=Agrococcus pavilionensis RW1 TaxID=1330458 RepID=U1MS68_9MICO|nr:hypothetical protein L332_03445 [Agrococcus pavilionensis RW1]
MLEVVELDEALDWSPACDGLVWRVLQEQKGERGCPEAATWIGTSVCCGRVGFYCDAHRRKRMQFVHVQHAPCGSPTAPIRWEPIGGGGRG